MSTKAPLYRVSQKKLTPLLFIWISNVSVFFDSPCILIFISGCRSTYIGKTDRCLYTRLKEHSTQENTDINAHINCCEHFQHINSLMELSPNSTNPINTNVTELIFRNCEIIDTSDHWSLADENLSSTTVRNIPKNFSFFIDIKLRLSWLYNSSICNFTLLLILRMTTN
jgi:hypothetical protein